MPNYLVENQLSSLALLNHRRAGDKFCLMVQDCQTQIKLKLQPNHWTKKYTLGKVLSNENGITDPGRDVYLGYLYGSVILLFNSSPLA